VRVSEHHVPQEEHISEIALVVADAIVSSGGVMSMMVAGVEISRSESTQLDAALCICKEAIPRMLE